jgi:hypothetical protein
MEGVMEAERKEIERERNAVEEEYDERLDLEFLLAGGRLNDDCGC